MREDEMMTQGARGYLTHLGRDDAAAPRDVGTFWRHDALHRLGVMVVVPLLVRARNERSFGVPPGDPGVAIIEKEEEQSFGLRAFVQSHRLPATSVLHFVFEDVSMEDAAVDQRDGDFLLVFAVVPLNEMPSPTRDVLVDARNRAFPMFLLEDGSLNALAALEPVSRAEDCAKADEKVWRHSIRYLNDEKRKRPD
ncbi:hypothetical protein V6Z77_001488 [Aspergillus fumigatus]